MKPLRHELPLLMLAGILAVALLGCGDSAKNAGGIWDETGNALAVRVVDSLGQPVAGAMVKMISQKEWSQNHLSGMSVISDSAETDKEGVVRLQSESWPVRLEIQHILGLATVFALGPDSNSSAKLEAPARLSGSIRNSQEGDLVVLAGSSFITSTDSLGEFSFSQIPAGAYTVGLHRQGKLSLLRQVSLTPNQHTTSSELQPDVEGTVLLEDFEDTIPGNRYNAFTGAGWWYCNADSLSRVIPNSIVEALEIVAESPQTGKAAHFVFDVNVDAIGKYALCGTDFGISRLDNPYTAQNNLAKLDRIGFFAKGSGTLSVQIVGLVANQKDSSITFQSTFEAPEEWSWVVLPIESFTAPNEAFSWTQIASSATTLTFLAKSPAELWVDNITLFGLSAHELFPQLRIEP